MTKATQHHAEKQSSSYLIAFEATVEQHKGILDGMIEEKAQDL